MYVKIRTVGGKPVSTLNLSRLCTVAEVKRKIQAILGVEPSKQKLYHRGKHLEDAYKLFDYNVQLNDVIQVLEIDEVSPGEGDKPVQSTTNEQMTDNTVVAEKKPTHVECPSTKYYKVGDLVDYRNMYQIQGAWCEGKILKILKLADSADEEGIVYTISCPEEHELVTDISPSNIRPRARRMLKWSDLSVGQMVMVNYNLDEEAERGFWYDMEVTALKKVGHGALVQGTLFVGLDRVPMENIKARFDYGVMAIEKPCLLAERLEGEEGSSSGVQAALPMRQCAPLCKYCKDNPRRKCKECSCHVCGGKDDTNNQILCDECDQPFHIGCLDPPLMAIPEDDWYCPECKNDENEIVKTGEKLKESKRKAGRVSSNAECSRDWGHGMATVGRTKVCSIVPANHFGSVPGVEVGTTWKFRVQASEAGVHRPPVSGIHGRENAGAYSIVLSGGYENDVDNGDEFVYSGSGGRDLSGNKRTAKQQSCNQELTRLNRAIAVNCNAPINDKVGATAKNWKDGKPIRVLRNYKLKKYSKYAPDDGNRYDGIYKVVKYYPEKGKSGFRVWRFKLRRDDPIPAPWTAEGKKRIKSLGLEMMYPEGYLDAKAAQEAEALDNNLNKSKGKGSKVKLDKSGKEVQSTPNRKRPLSESTSHSLNSKKQKLVAYKLDKEVNDLMALDSNLKLWEVCKAVLPEGKTKFMDKVMELFMCVCCQELIYQPVTMKCLHNICKGCLKNSFAAKVYTCPNCRCELGSNYEMEVNTNLSQILLKLFPGYEAGR